MTVAEVNLERTSNSPLCDYVFHGPAGQLLPDLLDVPAHLPAL